MEIKEIKDNKKKYMNLLLEADPAQEAVEKYIENSDTVKNFFIDNYEEEIWDGDLHCIDMYYYSKEL